MKIALIDSQQIFSEALKTMLLNSLPGIESVDHYSSIEAFVTSVSYDVPNIIITEISFKGQHDKFALDSIFHLYQNNTKLVILTSLNDQGLIRNYMLQGAKAFLTKTCSYQELLDAITQIQKGNLFLSEDVQNLLLTGLQGGWPSADDLSSIERAILEGLSRDDSMKAIAEYLDVSLIELKYYRKMLMTRFNLKRYTDLVDLAKKPGFLKKQIAERRGMIGHRGKPKPVRRRKEAVLHA